MLPAAYSPKRTKLMLRLRRAIVAGIMANGTPKDWAETKATEIIRENRSKIHKRSGLRDIVFQLENA